MKIEEIIKWLESLLSSGIISYSLFMAWLALLAIILDQIVRRISLEEVKMDLVAVTVLIDGRICQGVIDLEDPRGWFLKLLFMLNNNVSSAVVSTPLLHDARYTCIYSTINTPHPLTNYFTMGVGPLATYICIAFPSPNRAVWFLLQRYFHLTVYTGYDHFATRIYPSLFLNNIYVRGVEDIYLATLIPAIWQNW